VSSEQMGTCGYNQVQAVYKCLCRDVFAMAKEDDKPKLRLHSSRSAVRWVGRMIWQYMVVEVEGRSRDEGRPSRRGKSVFGWITNRMSPRPPRCRQLSGTCLHRSIGPPFSPLHRAPMDHKRQQEDPRVCRRRSAPVQTD
jgi:hypothetical protein